MIQYRLDQRGRVDCLLREDSSKQIANDIWQWWNDKLKRWEPSLGGVPFYGKKVKEEEAKKLFPEAFK